MKECVDSFHACGGDPVEPKILQCLFHYYIYNLHYRPEIKKCFTMSCAEALPACVCIHQLGGLPWVTIPQPPPDPVFPSCPPQ